MIAWIDLETTGLSLDCRIIEVACVVTDEKFDEKTDLFSSCVFLPRDAVTEETAVEMHVKSGLWEEIQHAKRPMSSVDRVVSYMIGKFYGTQKLILGGSSVHFDRGFIEKYMPATSRHLHYRNLDVSSIKFFASCLSGIPTEYLPPIKAETKHRAADDIRASLKAIRWYRDNMELAN